MPQSIADVEQLEEVLSTPTPALCKAVADWDDGLLVLGAGGKMGPSLCRLAVRAFAEAGNPRPVRAVSRFSDARARRELEAMGVETISCDILDPVGLNALPDCKNVVFMAGRKFGATGAESQTWAINVLAAAQAARRYPASRIVAFSSGNVYPFTPVGQGGSTESDPVAPVGEYAQSVLGRERAFEHFSRTSGTPVTLVRLNYAVELRYGVLVDIATALAAGQPIDVTMGHANVIWQRDANEVVLRAFSLCASPPAILNLTGPETLSIRRVAAQLAERMGVPLALQGEEAPTALLNNASRCHQLFGYPETSLGQMIDWIAAWIKQGGETHGKPTHFQTRDGKF